MRESTFDSKDDSKDEGGLNVARRKRRRRRGSSDSGALDALSDSWLLWGGIAAVVIAVAVGFVLFRSGSGGESASNPSAGGSIAAPDFPFSVYQGTDTLGGEEAKFSTLFGRGKPVVLNFWAGLCPPCRAEMPGFQRVHNEMGDQFILLGLDIGPFVGLGSREEGRALLSELNITYPAATTFEASTVAKYNVRGMPTTVFLTSNGEIFDTHTGFLNEETLRNKLQRLLQASEES